MLKTDFWKNTSTWLLLRSKFYSNFDSMFCLHKVCIWQKGFSQLSLTWSVKWWVSLILWNNHSRDWINNFPRWTSKRILPKTLLEENYMKLRILFPFWLFLLRLHCWLAVSGERTAEWKQSALAGGRKGSNRCVWCLGESTTSDMKITRDEAISAHELNEILSYSLSLDSNISRDCSRGHINFYHLPMRAANPMSWDAD